MTTCSASEFDVSKAGSGNAVFSPTVNSRDRALGKLGNGASTAEVVDDLRGCLFHNSPYAIIGSLSQVKTSDNRDCDNRMDKCKCAMVESLSIGAEAKDIFVRMAALDLTQRELAGALGIEENKISKVKSGERLFKAAELLKAREWLAEIESRDGFRPVPDTPPIDPQKAYMPVEILPSFAGMGGGGNGDGDPQTALVSVSLIRDELRANAADLLLIDVRGNSMEPEFHHGDQILIDRRDCNPIQPGAFALWDGEGYVIKLVERVPNQRGRYKIFSANLKYSAYEVNADEVTIMGRPVWFARRL